MHDDVRAMKVIRSIGATVNQGAAPGGFHASCFAVLVWRGCEIDGRGVVGVCGSAAVRAYVGF
jgi:hypothetical protein